MKFLTITATLLIVFSIAAGSIISKRDAEETTENTSSEEILDSLLSAVFEIVADSSEEVANSTTSKIEDLIEKHCPGQKESFTKAAEDVKTCYSESPIEDKTVCQYIKSSLTTCTKPLITEVEKCTPTEQKDLPDFIFKTIVNLLSFVCNSKGETLLEIFNPCLDPWEVSDECKKHVEDAATTIQNSTLVTKNQICELNTSLKPCIEKDIVKGCKNQVTIDAVNSLYHALTDECNATR